MRRLDVSVIVPCYNGAAHLAGTIRSVLAQDHKNFELIVVDDGSSDESTQVVQSFGSHGVRLVTQPNLGAAAARNRGYAEARGRCVLFLDSDDLIATSHLTALEDAAGGSDSLIAFGKWDRFYSCPGESLFPSRAAYRDAGPIDWLIQEWTTGHPMMQSAMFLIPRALIDSHGGWDERLSLNDDFEFFARMIASSAGLRFAAGARVYYRSGLPDSLSGRRCGGALESAWLSLSLGTECLLKVDNSSPARRACANMFQHFEYSFYPSSGHLCRKARRRVADLGGSDLDPSGPPGFQKLRPWIGWRGARCIQHLAERCGLNRASRTHELST